MFQCKLALFGDNARKLSEKLYTIQNSRVISTSLMSGNRWLLLGSEETGICEFWDSETARSWRQRHHAPSKHY